MKNNIFNLDMDLLFDIKDTSEHIQKELISCEHLSKIINLIPDLIWLTDIKGSYIAYNTQFKQFISPNKIKLIGKNDNDFFDKQNIEFSSNYNRKVLKSKKSIDYETELKLKDKTNSGHFKIIKTPIFDKNNNITSIMNIAKDMNEQKQKEDQLSQYANYDILTGLANRTLFMDRLQHLLNQRIQADRYNAILFIDLDHFKNINDTFGHSIGDKVLKLVSKKLKSTVRKGDTVSRHGGDEFAILLENIKSPLDAAKIAQNILDILKQPLLIDEHHFHITTSIGITIAPTDSTNAETLLRFADIAMYKSKNNGRDSYAFYTQDLSSQAEERIHLEEDLYSAIKNNEFILYYQSQINVETKKIIGAEALIRWNHPTKGLIMPIKFIPIAESSGQIIAIGKWVIKQAMQDMSYWKKQQFPIKMLSINLSVRQLNDKALVKIIKDTLEETNCKPEWIEFEVTEGYAMSDHQAATSLLEELSKLGFKISIDDFGTGYSSLAYLKQLPIQKIKIDQSFVNDVPGNADDESIVSAVIHIARSLNLNIIAEGVETSPQQDFLQQHGCLHAQGYLYTRPMPKDKFEKYLLEQKEVI